jgi:microcystin degradation protein MlrC
MRVFTAGLGTETNTFSPLYIGLEDFRDAYWYEPNSHPEKLTEVSAPLFVLRDRSKRLGWTVIEGSYVFALPGGRVGCSAYETLRDALLDQLRAALPVDFIALSLHGAMAAVGYDDCEGDLLARVRAIAGSSTPIGIEIDPHANLSQAMVEATDVIIAMKEYPHTDFLERGHELIDLLERAALGEVAPVQAVQNCRTIGRFHTFRPPMRGFVDQLQTLERHTPGVLSISLIHGFPWADVADMGAKVLVVCDADAALAARIAEEVGLEVEAIRSQAYTSPAAIADALADALERPPGPVVIADVSDNPGGGAAGDATILLRAVLDKDVRACLGPLWDPMAARIAASAGVGSTIKLRLGGKTGTAGGAPLDVEATVTAVSADGWQSWAGTRTSLGLTCAISINEVDVVISSIRDQAYSPDLFTNLGLDPGACRIVAVKSAQHFVHGFRTMGAPIILAGGGGPMETDFRKIDYRHISRPMWPLDILD